jgi:hypothetical protein
MMHRQSHALDYRGNLAHTMASWIFFPRGRSFEFAWLVLLGSFNDPKRNLSSSDELKRGVILGVGTGRTLRWATIYLATALDRSSIEPWKREKSKKRSAA